MIVLVAIGLIMLAYYMSKTPVEPSRQQYDVQAVVDLPAEHAIHRTVRRAARAATRRPRVVLDDEDDDPCEICGEEECLNCPHDQGDDED